MGTARWTVRALLVVAMVRAAWCHLAPERRAALADLLGATVERSFVVQRVETCYERGTGHGWERREGHPVWMVTDGRYDILVRAPEQVDQLRSGQTYRLLCRGRAMEGRVVLVAIIDPATER